MTIDKLRADLLLVAAIGNSIASVLGALGDSVSELELAVSRGLLITIIKCVP